MEEGKEVLPFAQFFDYHLEEEVEEEEAIQGGGVCRLTPPSPPPRGDNRLNPLQKLHRLSC